MDTHCGFLCIQKSVQFHVMRLYKNTQNVQSVKKMRFLQTIFYRNSIFEIARTFESYVFAQRIRSLTMIISSPCFLTAGIPTLTSFHFRSLNEFRGFFFAPLRHRMVMPSRMNMHGEALNRAVSFNCATATFQVLSEFLINWPF